MQLIKNGLVILCVASLSGCVEGFINSKDVDLLINESLEQSKREVKNNKEISIPTIPELITRSYKASKERDPFTIPDSLDTVFRKQNGNDNSAVTKIRLIKDPERPEGYIPHSLENYHLANVKMIGIIGLASGKLAALLDVGDKKIVPVKEGDYVGKNFGKVVKVTEKYIELSEKYGVAKTKAAANESSPGWQNVPVFVNLTVKK